MVFWGTMHLVSGPSDKQLDAEMASVAGDGDMLRWPASNHHNCYPYNLLLHAYNFRFSLKGMNAILLLTSLVRVYYAFHISYPAVTGNDLE